MKTAGAGCVPAHSPGQYGWKQSFRVFGTGYDRPSARLETAKNVPLYPSRHILSQHPHSHPSEWVPRGPQGRPNRQHTKNSSKVHKLHKRSSLSAPYKPYGVGTRKHFFGSKSKQNQKIKRFMIFDPKKRGGVIFSTFLTPPPPHPMPPPPLPPSKPQKSGLQVGGVWGAPDPKLIGGCVYWTK